LQRDRDLADIVNASWTRGFCVPRTVDGNVHEFDPFCFKVINGIDLLPHLEPATRSRCIVTDLLPKLAFETVTDFKHAASDECFETLRRKAMRWATDNAATIRGAEPAMPDGFSNRLAQNHILLFAIADLAGGDWPKRARDAAVKLSRESDQPSPGRRLLAIFHELFGRYGAELTSRQVEVALPVYGDEWANYRNHGRAINKWEIAALLRPFKIAPRIVHPRGGKTADRGYVVTDFEIAFRHYLGKAPPEGRSVVRKPRKKGRTTERPARPPKG
jgi:putative DNA primase/helicase